MNVIPGSYLEGLAAHGRAASEKGKLPALLEVNADADRAVPVPVKAGCGMVHHCMTLHQTDPKPFHLETVERWSSITCLRVREIATAR